MRPLRQPAALAAALLLASTCTLGFSLLQLTLLHYGDAVTGQITSAGQTNAYTFVGSQGDNVNVTVTTTQGYACVELLNSSGTLLGSSCIYGPLVVLATLPATGNYFITVYSYDLRSSVSYTLSLICPGCSAPPPPPPPQDLSRCVLPHGLNLTSRLGAALSRNVVQVGTADLSGCEVTVDRPFSASAEVLNGENWLSVSPKVGTLFAGQSNTINVDVDYSMFSAPGTYQGLVRITFVGSVADTVVPVNVSVTPPNRPKIALSWTSFVFQTVEGGSAPPTQTLRIYDGVPGTLNWTINTAGLPSWLRISQTAGTAGSEPGQGSPVSIGVDPTGLSAGANNMVYSALIPIAAAGAVNNPQYVAITYHVVRPTAAPTPQLTSYGLLFVASANGPAPPPQAFTLTNIGGGTVGARFAVSTQNGGGWLTMSQTSGDTAAGPLPVQVNASPSGLTPGVYHGKITAAFTLSDGRSVPQQELNVVFIVTPQNIGLQRSLGAAAGTCTPDSMDLVGTTIGNGATAAVSFPQVLLGLVVDNCGSAVTTASVVVAVEGITIALQPSGGGFYTGTWVPQRSASSLPITFSVFHPNFATVRQTFTISTAAASGGTVLPVVFAEGVVEGAGFTAGRPLAPGSIVSLFGSKLASSVASASQIPLERELSQVSVRIGGVNAPLYFVSDGQINAQVPFELSPGDTVAILVNNGGRLTAPQTYQISAAQPGIFKGENGPAILDSQFRPITPQNPARRGDVLQIFANGLGLTDPPVATGALGPPFSNAQIPVTATVGGVSAQVVYQGLAPGFVGLNQVNVVVPADVAPGPAVPVVIRQNGVESNPNLPITIPVS